MKRVHIFKILSISIGLLASLLIGEIVCRIYLFGTDALSYSKMASPRKMAYSGYVQKAVNQRTLYELKPNIDALFKRRVFKTNQEGYRDQAYSTSKPANTIRGVVIGDSFTMGSGVNLEDVYHSIIEDKLNQGATGIKYELLNFGVSGYNLLSYLGNIEHKVAAYEPDFIIIGFCANNDFILPKETQITGEFVPKVPKTRTSNFFTSYLKEIIQDTYWPKAPSKAIRQGLGEEQEVFIQEIFSQFQAYSDANQIPFFINYLSIIKDNGNADIIKKIAQQNNLYFVDAYDQLDLHHLDKYRVHRLDQHPNRAANELFANALLVFPAFQEIVSKKGSEESIHQ